VTVYWYHFGFRQSIDLRHLTTMCTRSLLSLATKSRYAVAVFNKMAWEKFVHFLVQPV